MPISMRSLVCLSLYWFLASGAFAESLQYPIEVIPLSEDCGHSIQAFSNDERAIATGAPVNESQVAVWDRSGQLIKVLKTGVSVGTLEIIPGKPIVLGIIEGAIFEWNFETSASRIVHKFQDSRWCIECEDWFAVSPDGRYAAISGFKEYLLIYDITAQKVNKVGIKGDSRGIEFSPDSGTLYFVVEGKGIRSLDVSSRVINDKVYSVDHCCGHAAIDWERDQIVAWDHHIRGIRIWDRGSGKLLRTWKSLKEMNALLAAPWPHFYLDGMATTLLNTETGQQWEFKYAFGNPFRGGGSNLISGCPDPEIRGEKLYCAQGCSIHVYDLQAMKPQPSTDPRVDVLIDE